MTTVAPNIVRGSRRGTATAIVFGCLAVGAWMSSVGALRGVGMADRFSVGSIGFFVALWVVMMAAMMFPSLAPTVALYARMTDKRHWARPLLFAGGYLLVWGAGGLVSYGLFRLGKSVLGGDLAWYSGGRFVAGGVLAVAALYELTPLKHVCLARCRSPLGFLLGTWRDGGLGALEMGSRHAAWCVGCCWALMAALFALGVMSLTWMAFVAALIAIEKTLPWRRVATWGTATVLLALAVAVVAAPHAVPGLVILNGAHGAMG
jgi:predicted metal-binding membrane protein